MPGGWRGGKQKTIHITNKQLHWQPGGQKKPNGAGGGMRMYTQPVSSKRHDPLVWLLAMQPDWTSPNKYEEGSALRPTRAAKLQGTPVTNHAAHGSTHPCWRPRRLCST